MNKEEKSLLDELFEAAGLSEPKQPEPQKEPVIEEQPKPVVKESAAEEPKTEEIKRNNPIIEDNTNKLEISEEKDLISEVISQNIAEIQEKKKKKKKQEEKIKEHETKKKDIKFLVIYTIVFVVVISSLIGGSYVITSRIHQQMSENNQNLNSSQSSLKNIQDENNALKQENAALKQENDALSATAEDANALLESVGDMIEHDSYLAGAQNAYIDGERNHARKLMAAIDREKLSQPAKEYYDVLKNKLGL